MTPVAQMKHTSRGSFQTLDENNMTTRLLMTIAFACMCSSCSKADDQGAVSESKVKRTVAVPAFTKQHVTSSRRSHNAIARVAPSLVSDLYGRDLTYGSPVFIQIFKEEKELEMWIKKEDAFQLFRTYSIVAMSGHLGPKLREGDRQSPEGFYFVTPSRMNPNSRFHLSFNLGYPNRYDQAHKRTGSALMVHGNRVSIGCFAMTDPKIEEIYCLADAALRNGQKFFRVLASDNYIYQPTTITLTDSLADNLRSFRREDMSADYGSTGKEIMDGTSKMWNDRGGCDEGEYDAKNGVKIYSIRRTTLCPAPRAGLANT